MQPRKKVGHKEAMEPMDEIDLGDDLGDGAVQVNQPLMDDIEDERKEIKNSVPDADLERKKIHNADEMEEIDLANVDEKLTLAKIRAIVEKNIIQEILDVEIKRLSEKYPNGEHNDRIQSLKDAKESIIAKMEDIERNNKHKKYDLTSKNDLKSIRQHLEFSITSKLDNFDKRKGVKGWGAKIGRAALNVLSALSIAAPILKKKYHYSQTSFFSLRGKTHDAGEKALDTLKEKIKPKPR